MEKQKMDAFEDFDDFGDFGKLLITNWRSMTQDQRSDAMFEIDSVDELDHVVMALLAQCRTRREAAEVFVASSMTDHVGSICNVERAMSLLAYLDEPGGADVVLGSVRFAAWAADGRAPHYEISEDHRRVYLAVKVLSAAASVDFASTRKPETPCGASAGDAGTDESISAGPAA